MAGAGFGGLAISSLLGRDGHEVTVLEKNEQPGGRASVYSERGFNFDMGPSWYLMPDVYEGFFAEFGKKPQDFFKLERLDPSYRMYFGGKGPVDVHADLQKNFALFDSLEKDGGTKLKRYLDSSKEKYDLAIKELLYRDYMRLTDFLDRKLLKQGRSMHIFENLDKFVNKHFESDRAKKIVEYSVGFLGGSPKNTPAFYHIMSHIDFNLGVWYPEGGMRQVVQSMRDLAESYGVVFKFDEPVTGYSTANRKIEKVVTTKGEYPADAVVVNADYAYHEMQLLEQGHQTYSERFWRKKVMAPSAMVAYIGVNKKIDQLAHHNLFLDEDWSNSFDQIFDPDRAAWPTSPSYYVNVPSRTDKSAAPSGSESLFVLVPLAPGLDDSEQRREAFFQKVLSNLERTIGVSIADSIVVKRIFALNDFQTRYNAYRGTALGLAHTLGQTALFRPRHKSKRLGNLYYTGHYCHPGIGVPMVLISSQIVAKEIQED